MEKEEMILGNEELKTLGIAMFWRSSVDERKIERKLVDRVDRKAS